MRSTPPNVVPLPNRIADEALIQQHIVAHFEKPSKRSLKVLNHILDDNSKRVFLIGKEYTTWSDAEISN